MNRSQSETTARQGPAVSEEGELHSSLVTPDNAGQARLTYWEDPSRPGT